MEEGIDFKEVTLSDRAVIEKYLRTYESQNCERTFACTYLWRKRFPVTWAIVCDTLVFKSRTSGRTAYTFPAGEEEDAYQAVEQLKGLSREKGEPFLLYMITPRMFEQLDRWYPGLFTVEYYRNAADYVYETEKLRDLPGKKYHGKRNHIHQFKKQYDGRWSYEPMTGENTGECLAMAGIWGEKNDCELDPEKKCEMEVTREALTLFEPLHLTGGLLKVDGDVVAFTIGEPLSRDMFVVHFEKAYPDVPGAYTMINQQFVEHACTGYTYVNREEDTGAEGLRKAKLSYHPAFLVEKGFVEEKENKKDDC